MSRPDHHALRADENTAAAGEHALVLGAGLAAHNVVLHRFYAERKGGQTVGNEVDPQQLDRHKRRLLPEDHGDKHGQNLAQVAGEQELNGFCDIIENTPALFDGCYNGREIVVGQRHIRRALRHVGSGNTHRAADVGRLERRGRR